MPDKTRGLYKKFNVTRVDGTDQKGGKHEGCHYLVLDLDHDPIARTAAIAYANEAHKAGYNDLSADIENLVLDCESDAT